MNVRRHVTWICLILAAVSVAESSILTKKSLLSPTRQTCFTCKAEDKPFAWPLISQLVKIKDAVLRAVNTLTDKISKNKLI